MRYSLLRGLIELIMTYDYDKPRKMIVYAKLFGYTAAMLSMLGGCVFGLFEHYVLMLLFLFLLPPVFIFIALFVIRKAEKMIKEEEKYHTDSPAVFDAPDTEPEPEPEKTTVVCLDCGTRQPSDRKTCLSCGAELPQTSDE